MLTISHPDIIAHFPSEEDLTQFILMYMKVDEHLNIKLTIDPSPTKKNPEHHLEIQEIKLLISDIHRQFITSNSSKLGKVGEDVIASMLPKIFPTYEISHITSFAGDFLLSRPDHKFLIEVKNFSSNVPQRDIDKFVRDCTINGCDGIFVSKGNICGKSNLHLDITDDRAICYVIGFEESFILAAYNLLRSSPKNTNSSIQFSDDEIEAIKCDYHKLTQIREALIVSAQNIIDHGNKISFPSLAKLVGEKLDDLKCYICCKKFKTRNNVEKHMKAHQK